MSSDMTSVQRLREALNEVREEGKGSFISVEAFDVIADDIVGWYEDNNDILAANVFELFKTMKFEFRECRLSEDWSDCGDIELDVDFVKSAIIARITKTLRWLWYRNKSQSKRFIETIGGCWLWFELNVFPGNPKYDDFEWQYNFDLKVICTSTPSDKMYVIPKNGKDDNA